MFFNLALLIDALCDRPSAASDRRSTDQLGRLVQGPDEKLGLAGTVSLPSRRAAVRWETVAHDAYMSVLSTGQDFFAVLSLSH